jgi:hypothetical protein
MKAHEIPIIIIGFILGIFLLSKAFATTSPNLLAFIGNFIKAVVK